MITKPIGTPAVPVLVCSGGNVGITKGGGGVRVGIRVAGGWGAKRGGRGGVGGGGEGGGGGG